MEFVKSKMLTLCLSGCRCQQDACCQKIRNAENQTVIPNTCLQPLTQAQTIYAANTGTTNELAEARPVSLPGVLIKAFSLCLCFYLVLFSFVW